MKKDEFIRRYGEAMYEKTLEQKRVGTANNPDEIKRRSANYNHETHRKGGKRYSKHLRYSHAGLQGARNKIRTKDAKYYSPYKQIIAPGSQIHHEWISGTADYRGTALVEAIQHQYGIIDPVVILEGEITLLTEAEIRGI